MSDTTVLGRPVTGEISYYARRDRCEQWPAEKFLELLDAVLDCPNVEAVRWYQYTPYFNDGDACIFHTGECYVKLVDGDPEAGDYEDGFVGSYELADWDRKLRKYTPKPGLEQLYPAFDELADSLDHFEEFLHDSFGDPAEVTATTDGFSVEFYDHD